MELLVNPVDALCDTGDYHYYNTFRRLVGVDSVLERLLGNRRGRDHADPDKRGFAAVARHGDGMIHHPCNTLVGGLREIHVDARFVTSRQGTDAPSSLGETLLWGLETRL